MPLNNSKIPIPPKTVQSRYQKLFEEKNISKLDALQNRSGVKHLSRIVNGETFPTITVLHKLANSLDMKIGELCERIYSLPTNIDTSQDIQVREDLDVLTIKIEPESFKWQIKLQGELNNLTVQSFMGVQIEIRQFGGANQMAINVSEGCILIEFEGSLEGFEKIQALVKSGELKELAGFEILDIGLVDETQESRTIVSSLVNLRDWLQGTFENEWLSIEQLLTSQQLAPSVFSGEQQTKIERAKQYQLGDYQVNLVVEVTQKNEDEVAIALKIYPVGTENQIYLPANIRLTISTDGEELPTITSREQTRLMQKLIDADFGDKFTLTLGLDNNIITEKFEV